MIAARGRAVAGAAALAAATAGWVGPGAAPASAYVCSSGIDSPARGSVVGASSVGFAGRFDVRPMQADRVLEISFTSSPGPRPPTVRRTGSGVGSDGRFDVVVGDLSRNGQYTARLRFVSTGTSLLDCDNAVSGDRRDTEQTAEVAFGVSVKARPPTNVRASFEAGPRNVVVRWGSSPDPDTAGYTVTRKVGSADFEPVAAVPGNATSFTDTKLPGAAFTITYAVSSSRNGPDSRTTSEASESVAAAPLGVPAPAPSSTTPTTAATTASTAAPFVLGQPAGVTDPGAAPAPSFPDGLTPLPLGPDDGGDQSSVPPPAPPEERVQLPGDTGGRGGSDDGLPGLAYAAATLLSAAVAAHVLWRRNPLLRPGAPTLDTTLPVEPAPAQVAAPRPPPPPPIRAAAPAPRRPTAPAAAASRPPPGPPPPVPASAQKPILIVKSRAGSGRPAPADQEAQGR